MMTGNFKDESDEYSEISRSHCAAGQIEMWEQAFSVSGFAVFTLNSLVSALPPNLTSW